MNIAGMEFNMPGFLSGFSLSGIMSGIMVGIIVLAIVGVLGYFGWSWFNNKANYNTPCTLTIKMDNGTKKNVYGLKGGKYTNKSGTIDFRVKVPGVMKTKELGFIPDMSKADADGTIHFITTGDNIIWQQLEHQLITKEVKQYLDEENKELLTYEYELLVKPIRADVKTTTVNSIRSFGEMVNKNKMAAFTIAMGAFVIMVIAHLISLYIQTKIKCPGA
jgi:hypothetical protein